MSNKTDTHFGFALMIIIGIAVLVKGLWAVMGHSGPSGAMDNETVAERIAPIGQLNTGEAIVAAAPAPAAPAAPRSGEELYNGTCAGCHASGVLGAPKFGDAGDWAPRLEKGVDGLTTSAINGLNAMPPRGGCANCSDDEMRGAVEYMVNAAQ